MSAELRGSRVALWIGLCVMTLACGGVDVGQGSTEESMGPLDETGCPSQRTPEACQVFALVNQERAAQGRPALTYDLALAKAAHDHAADMKAHGYFSHDSQDGRTFGQRAKAAGYDGFPSAENIAWGQRDAQAVMASWMGSSGHRRNILGGSNELGVGYVDGLWVQVFGTR